MLWEIVKLSDSQQSELRNKVSLALMYLFALLHCFSQIKCLSFSILNHYSKLVKLVQTIVNCLSIFGNTDKQ